MVRWWYVFFRWTKGCMSGHRRSFLFCSLFVDGWLYWIKFTLPSKSIYTSLDAFTCEKGFIKVTSYMSDMHRKELMIQMVE